MINTKESYNMKSLWRTSEVIEFDDVKSFIKFCMEDVNGDGDCFITRSKINEYDIKEGLVLDINEFRIGQIDEVFIIDDYVKFLTYNYGGHNREYGMIMKISNVKKIKVYLVSKQHYNLMKNQVTRI